MRGRTLPLPQLGTISACRLSVRRGKGDDAMSPRVRQVARWTLWIVAASLVVATVREVIDQVYSHAP